MCWSPVLTVSGEYTLGVCEGPSEEYLVEGVFVVEEELEETLSILLVDLLPLAGAIGDLAGLLIYTSVGFP